MKQDKYTKQRWDFAFSASNLSRCFTAWKDKDQRECLSVVIQKEKETIFCKETEKKTLIPDTS